MKGLVHRICSFSIVLQENLSRQILIVTQSANENSCIHSYKSNNIFVTIIAKHNLSTDFHTPYADDVKVSLMGGVRPSPMKIESKSIDSLDQNYMLYRIHNMTHLKSGMVHCHSNQLLTHPQYSQHSQHLSLKDRDLP